MIKRLPIGNIILSMRFCVRGGACHHESEIGVVDELVKFCGKAMSLPYRFTCGWAAVYLCAGGEGEISPADGGGWAVG